MIRVKFFFFHFYSSCLQKKHHKIDAFLLFLQLILKQDNENT